MKEFLKAKLPRGLIKNFMLLINIIKLIKYKLHKIILNYLLKISNYMPFITVSFLKTFKLELKHSISIQEYLNFSPDKIRIYGLQTLDYSFSKPIFWPFIDSKHFKNLRTYKKDFFFMN